MEKNAWLGTVKKIKIEKNIIESSKTDQQKSLKGGFAFGPCKKVLRLLGGSVPVVPNKSVANM